MFRKLDVLSADAGCPVMSLSDQQRKDIFNRAGGRCECAASFCSRHPPRSRCPHPLAAGFWDATARDWDAPRTLDNIVAMCAACLEETAYLRPAEER